LNKKTGIQEKFLPSCSLYSRFSAKIICFQAFSAVHFSIARLAAKI